MRSFTLTLLFACFLFSDLSFSQELGPPVLFGKISDEELKMTVYDKDTSAAAVVLCDYGNVEVQQHPDRLLARFAHYKRIKILKKQGFDYGNVAIPFYSHQKSEEFFLDKAEVRLPGGEKIKLTKKDVFIEAVNDKWSQARFAFPQLQEGCIIEYNYFINSQSVYQLPEWYFQEAIPVKWSELRVTFPSWLVYTYLFQGNEGMQKVEEKDGMAVFAGKNGTCRISPRRIIMQDAPAMKEESYVTTMTDYLAKIQFQLSEIRYPDGKVEPVLDSWQEMQLELEHQPFFGEQYHKKGNFKKLAGEILPLAEHLGTQKEKADFYYDYLTSKMEWNGYFSLWTRSEKLDNIFEKKQGNSAELNLMLLALLRESGITAYPLLTSTRSNGKMYENYPILDQFNHVMVFAIPDAQPVIMDASTPLLPAGYPNVSALNGRGWLMKQSPSWMDIKPPPDAADVFNLEMTLEEDGSMTGWMKGAYKGYNSAPERRHFRSDSTGVHWNKRLAKRFADVKVDSVQVGNLNDLKQPFFDTLFLSLPNAAQANGDFLYLAPVLYSGFEENPFKLQERNYPVDFPYPLLEQYMLKVKLPPGYSVEELPQPAVYSLPNSGGSFRFATEEKEEGILHVSTRLQILQLRFTPEEYKGIKELFDLVAEKCGEQIVLKKKT